MREEFARFTLKNSTDASKCNTTQLLVKEEINLVVPTIRATVEGVVNPLKELVEKSVKSYSEVVGAMEVEETDNANENDKKKKPKNFVQEVVRETTKQVLEASMTKIDTDHLERSRRECNVVVKKVVECDSDDDDRRTAFDKNFCTETLGIPESEIKKVYRAGPRMTDPKDGSQPVKNTCRPMIIRMVDKESADYWTDNGNGWKTSGYYINQNL